MRTLAFMVIGAMLAVACGGGTGGGAPATATVAPVVATQEQACAVPGNAKLPLAACDIVAKAKTETSLTINSGTGTTKPLEEGFEKYFGFTAGSIKYDFKQIFHPQFSAQVLAGAKQGVPSGFDIYSTSQNGLYEFITQPGGSLFREVDWIKTFGMKADDLLLDGKVTYSHSDFRAGLIYNKNKIKVEDLPKTYQALLDPKWKGQLIMPRSAGFASNMSLSIGEAEMLKVVQGLAGTPPGSGIGAFAASNQDVRARVITGEFTLGIGVDGGSQMLQGAPIGEHAIEPIPVQSLGLAVLKDAKSPNLAMLYAFWVAATAEGQKATEQVFNKSRHTVPNSKAFNYIGTRKIVLADQVFETKTALDLEKKINPILGIR